MSKELIEKLCKGCGETFFVTEREQDFFKSKGMSLPKRCVWCRQKRRDNKKLDLSTCIGKYIIRTQPSIYGDRSYLDKPIKLVGIDKDKSINYQYKPNTFLYDNGKIYNLEPEYNDGYWKVVES